jgi:hypothetical protein
MSGPAALAHITPGVPPRDGRTLDRMNWERLIELGRELPEVEEDVWYGTRDGAA